MALNTWRLCKGFPWITSASLVTTVFLFLNRLLLLGKAAPIWDAEAGFLPYFVLLSDAIRAGRFLYWNPWSSGGEPLTANAEVGVFSPLRLLAGLVTGGSLRGFNIYWLFVWWLGGMGILVLGRHFGASPWGASVVTLGFLYCGFYTGNAEHTSLIVSFSFLPWVIWRLDVGLRDQRLWPAIEAGALWGLSALSGYPGFTMATGMYAGMWAFGTLVTRPPRSGLPKQTHSPGTAKSQRPTFAFVCVALVALLLTGVVVMSPTYFSFLYEGAGFADRINPLSREMATMGNALHPGALATFASPYLILLKLSDFGALWPYTDVSSCSIYAGGVVTALAVFALVMRPRSRWRWWLAFMAALIIACALGRTLPLRGWLYDFIYPTRFVRHASTFRAYYLFTLSILALLATKTISAGRFQHEHRWRLFGIALVLASGACTAILLVHRIVPADLRRVSLNEYLHLGVIWGGICVVAFIAAKWPSLRARSFVPVALTILAVFDVFTTATASAPTMMTTDAGFVAYKRGLDHHRTELDLPNGLAREFQSMSPGQHLNNDQVITKTPVFLNYSVPNAFHSAIAQNQSLRRIAIGDERIWFSATVGRAESTNECFAAFARRTEQLGAPPLLIQSADEVLGGKPGDLQPTGQTDWDSRMSALPASNRIHVNLIAYTPETLSFDADAPRAGWLLVTDRWARSWVARVNGQTTPVYCGDFIFRVVPVSAGQNRVEFSYKPKAIPMLVVISWTSLALVCAGSLYFRRRALKRPTEASR